MHYVQVKCGELANKNPNAVDDDEQTFNYRGPYPESIECEDRSITLNEVDSWIDMLNACDLSKTCESPTIESSNAAMMWLVQQSLHRM